jgi:G3E family GTPase
MLQSDVRKVSAYKAEMQEIIYSKDIMEDNEMTKVDIISGFLGAGKTTLIAKLLKEAFPGEQVVLIENEFGEIGIDGGFLKESGVEIREMNSGCICCSLVGDFGTSLKEVVEKYHPDRIIIEPSGVGKLSDVIKAVKDLHIENEIRLNSASTVADASKVKVYMKNFGEFFNNQIEHAGTIILSRTQNVSEAKLKTDIELIRSLNKDAHIITTPWDDINGKQILDAMENVTNLELEMLAEAAAKAAEEHEHEHHHDGECGCGHDHDHEHEHHHDHDGECGCGHDHDHEHEHHHDHDGECSCGHDHHHGHHHADEVFTSWGVETPDKYDKETLSEILRKLSETDDYGDILRAKGMLPTPEGKWMFFDLVPEEYEIRDGEPEITGRICVIGAKLKEDALKELFNV